MIYTMTGRIDVAVDFMTVSNIYATIGYFLHERLWARISWGACTRIASVGPKALGGRSMEPKTRRTVLFDAATTVVVGLAAGCSPRGPKAGASVGQKEEEEVAPGEDLMREHGVLNRLLLVYEEVGRRIQARQSYPADVVTRSADIVRRFIEGYHEKLEEDQLFPRFEKAGRLVDLVAVLRAQHERGRALTAEILGLAAAPLTQSTRERLVDVCRLFIRMYRPHEAREDTVLFPAFHRLVSQREYESLGDVFEDKEHELFGARGFDGIVDEVAQIERALGIYELSQFTPA